MAEAEAEAEASGAVAVRTQGQYEEKKGKVGKITKKKWYIIDPRASKFIPYWDGIGMVRSSHETASTLGHTLRAPVFSCARVAASCRIAAALHAHGRSLSAPRAVAQRPSKRQPPACCCCCCLHALCAQLNCGCSCRVAARGRGGGWRKRRLLHNPSPCRAGHASTAHGTQVALAPHAASAYGRTETAQALHVLAAVTSPLMLPSAAAFPWLPRRLRARETQAVGPLA